MRVARSNSSQHCVRPRYRQSRSRSWFWRHVVIKYSSSALWSAGVFKDCKIEFHYLKASTVVPSVLHVVAAYLGVTPTTYFFLACLSMIHQCRIQNSHDPISFYVDNSDEYARGHSLSREHQAADFFNCSGRNPTTHDVITPLQMCLGIATGARHIKEYVNATIGSLLTG